MVLRHMDVAGTATAARTISFHLYKIRFPKPLPLVTIEMIPKENCDLELRVTKPQPFWEADAIWGKADQDIAKKHDRQLTLSCLDCSDIF